MKLPIARTKDIVEQSLRKELLLYDLKINKYYSLNETLTLIYRHCDGQTTFSELKEKHRELTDEVIQLGISELSKENLLADKIESPLSRRALLNRAAVSAIALPIIMGLVAPTSAEAQSCVANGQTCSLSNPGACCSTRCTVTSSGNVCASLTCTAEGQPCSLSNPGACCSTRCASTSNGTVCVPLTCTGNGQPCSLSDPGACCSTRCASTANGTVCVPLN